MANAATAETEETGDGRPPIAAYLWQAFSHLSVPSLTPNESATASDCGFAIGSLSVTDSRRPAKTAQN